LGSCFCFFFFKQKTAYEMRISDWSSDVGSSDLGPAAFSFAAGLFFAGATGRKLHSSNSLGENPLPWLGNIVQRGIRVQSRQVQGELAPERQQPERRWDDRKLPSRGMKCVSPLSARSEGRRGGKGGVSTCKSGG